MPATPPAVKLTVPLEEGFLEVATSTVEAAGGALGLAGPGALSLRLAVEEIFSRLGRGRSLGRLDLEIFGLGHGVRLDLALPRRNLDLRLFNLTARAELDDEAGLSDLGLFIAARSVDGFSVSEADGGSVVLRLVKEKAYPHDDLAAPEISPADAPVEILPGTPELSQGFARRLAADFPVSAYPPGLAQPGRLADMVASGEFRLALALGREGRLAGGVVWRVEGQQAEMMGPYLFGRPSGDPLAATLVDACLRGLAKSEAMGLICRFPGVGLPAGYFETLGRLTRRLAGGGQAAEVWHFRQMTEDPGRAVWSHPATMHFLGDEYRRLFLPRQVRPIRHAGERRPSHSLIGVSLDRARSEATLRPLMDGADFGDNLADHLKLLADEGVADVRLATDQGVSWQASLAESLAGSGLEPRLVLPWAGAADVIIWQPMAG